MPAESGHTAASSQAVDKTIKKPHLWFKVNTRYVQTYTEDVDRSITFVYYRPYALI